MAGRLFAFEHQSSRRGLAPLRALEQLAALCPTERGNETFYDLYRHMGGAFGVAKTQEWLIKTMSPVLMRALTDKPPQIIATAQPGSHDSRVVVPFHCWAYLNIDFAKDSATGEGERYYAVKMYDATGEGPEFWEHVNGRLATEGGARAMASASAKRQPRGTPSASTGRQLTMAIPAPAGRPALQQESASVPIAAPSSGAESTGDRPPKIYAAVKQEWEREKLSYKGKHGEKAEIIKRIADKYKCREQTVRRYIDQIESDGKTT